MKRCFVFLVSAVLFMACHNTDESVSHNRSTTFQEEATAPVRLNKDHRWTADAATNKNVAWLQQKAAKRNGQPHDKAEDYQQTAAALQTGLNQLIKDCTMKGKDHDALHLWLEPLLQDNRALQTVTDVNAGDRLFHSVRTRLADYNLYFN